MGSGASIQNLNPDEVGNEVAGLGAAYVGYKAIIIDNCIGGEILAKIADQDEFDRLLLDAGVVNNIHRKVICTKFFKQNLLDRSEVVNACISASADYLSMEASDVHLEGGILTNSIASDKDKMKCSIKASLTKQDIELDDNISNKVLDAFLDEYLNDLGSIFMVNGQLNPQYYFTIEDGLLKVEAHHSVVSRNNRSQVKIALGLLSNEVIIATKSSKKLLAVVKTKPVRTVSWGFSVSLSGVSLQKANAVEDNFEIIELNRLVENKIRIVGAKCKILIVEIVPAKDDSNKVMYRSLRSKDLTSGSKWTLDEKSFVVLGESAILKDLFI